MDFVSDSLANGRRIKCLTVADDFSHECVQIGIDFGISGEYVTRLLDEAASVPRLSAGVRTDNGPEFTSRAFMAWAQAHGIRHILIEPGRPMQNGYIESFNGKFRDECLNEHWLSPRLPHPNADSDQTHLAGLAVECTPKIQSGSQSCSLGGTSRCRPSSTRAFCSDFELHCPPINCVESLPTFLPTFAIVLPWVRTTVDWRDAGMGRQYWEACYGGRPDMLDGRPMPRSAKDPSTQVRRSPPAAALRIAASSEVEDRPPPSSSLTGVLR